MLSALLTEMSGFGQEEGIVVIVAINRLDMLDKALLRPGRFDRHIECAYYSITLAGHEKKERSYLKENNKSYLLSYNI